MLTEIDGIIKVIDDKIVIVIKKDDYKEFKKYKNAGKRGDTTYEKVHFFYTLNDQQVDITASYSREEPGDNTIMNVKFVRKNDEERSKHQKEMKNLLGLKDGKNEIMVKFLLCPTRAQLSNVKTTELEAAEEQLEEKNEELEAAKKEDEEKQQELQTKLNTADEELKAKENEIKSLKAKINQPNAEVEGLKKDLQAQKDKVQQLEEKNEELEAAKKEDEEKQQELQTKLNTADEELKAKENEIKSLKAKINQPNAEVEGLKKDLQAQKDKVQQLEEKNEELEAASQGAQNKTTEQPKQGNGARYTATVGMSLAAGLIAFTALERTVRLDMLVMIGIAVASALVAGGITYAALPSTQVDGAKAQEVNENGKNK